MRCASSPSRASRVRSSPGPRAGWRLHGVEDAALAGQPQQLLVEQGQGRMPLHDAAARRQLAGQHAQQGGFSRTVVADHGDALPAADLQLQRRTAAMRQHQGFGLQQTRAATFACDGNSASSGATCTADAAARSRSALACRRSACTSCAAVAGLGALLLPAEQDGGLVGLLRIAIATRLALLLPFVLFARAALLLLGARMVELGGGSFALGGARIGVVLPRSAVTMQPAPIELDDLLHVPKQLAIMTDRQQRRATAATARTAVGDGVHRGGCWVRPGSANRHRWPRHRTAPPASPGHR